jgi:hypothetical protein
MIVWSLTTKTENGLSADLYLTGIQAYEALIRDWFPEPSCAGYNAAATAALARGLQPLKEWLSSYLDTTRSLDSYLVTRHDHPWTFGPVTEDERFAKLREFLAESPLSVVDAQAVSDIIDGPREPELCECGRKYRDCIAYDNGDDFQHGDR